MEGAGCQVICSAPTIHQDHGIGEVRPVLDVRHLVPFRNSEIGRPCYIQSRNTVNIGIGRPPSCPVSEFRDGTSTLGICNYILITLSRNSKYYCTFTNFIRKKCKSGVIPHLIRQLNYDIKILSIFTAAYCRCL